ncbi:hypothetical protein ACQ4PT_012770 [Festuca glaucescens]
MAERPVAPVRSTDDGFWLERDLLMAMGYQDQYGQDQHALLLLHDDHAGDAPDYSEDDYEDAQMVTHREEDSDDDDDTDDSEEEEESDGEFDELWSLLPRFLLRGPAPQHFVAAGRTAGFMRLAAADAPHQEEGGGERHILVHYRYTRFSAASSSDGSVEARGSTREHQLRFIAAAGHGARSLEWAGASLAHLIYPDGSSKRLRELWTSLASQVSLPPGAARVQVFVEVGILRKANSTQASMDQMRAALEHMMEKPWPTRFTGMELNQPEPVRCGCGHDEDDNDTDGEQRPAKRRKVVATDESCSVCYELLKGDDLAAWPGCSKPHVLHGACMQAVLESNPLCPMCRRDLYIQPKF